jgi:hypothetical protein
LAVRMRCRLALMAERIASISPLSTIIRFRLPMQTNHPLRVGCPKVHPKSSRDIKRFSSFTNRIFRKILFPPVINIRHNLSNGTNIETGRNSLPRPLFQRPSADLHRHWWPGRRHFRHFPAAAGRGMYGTDILL